MKRQAFGLLVLVSGLLGFLWPVLSAPVTTDEQYHYLSGPSEAKGSLITLVQWTISDMSWRAHAGRITPVGVFVEHAIYASVSDFAAQVGTDIYILHGAVKLGLVLLSVMTFAWLIQATRVRRTDSGAARRLTRPVRLTLLTSFAVLFPLGATVNEASRNGWTAFPVLCIGAVVVTFGCAAIVLTAINRWPRSGRLGRTLIVIGLAGLGVVLTMTYELHYVAVPVAVILGIWQGTNDRSFRESLRTKAAVLVPFLVGFTVVLLAIRWELHRLCREGCYVGLTPQLDPRGIAVTMERLFLSAFPGSSNHAIADTVRASTTAHPHAFGGSGWIWAVLVVLGLVLLLPRLPGATREDAAADLRALIPLSVAAVVAIPVAAAILAVTELAQKRVSYIGYAYRPTPVMWAMLAVLGSVAVVWLWSRRPRPTSVVVPLALAALAVGIISWPYQAASTMAFRSKASVVLTEAVHHEFVLGGKDSASNHRRCRLEAQLRTKTSPHWQRFSEKLRDGYEYLWGQPFCDRS